MTIENVVAPIRGTAETVWGQLLNTSFSAMDAHDHSINNGSTVNTSNLNFNGDFSCGSLTSWQEVALTESTFVDSTTLVTDGTDLIAYDGITRQIFVTKDGALNSPTTVGGGFTGDYVTASAQATYTSLTNTYQFFNGAAQLSTLVVGAARTSNLLFAESLTSDLFSVSVTASNSIIFSLPFTSAGIAYRSGGLFLTTPYLICDAANSIASRVRLGYASYLTNGFVAATADVNSVQKYHYQFNQGKGNTRSLSPSNTVLSVPSTVRIPFVECGIQQAAPVVQYTSNKSAGFIYQDPSIQYTVNQFTTGRLFYSPTLAYQVVYFVSNTDGSPVSGGLGG